MLDCEYKKEYDYSYCGRQYHYDNGKLGLIYENGPIDDMITIEPTGNVGVIAKIVRDTHYDDGEKYKQVYDITGLVGNKRYVMSRSNPIAELEYINEHEYMFRLNPLYSMGITADFITVDIVGGGVVFFDGSNDLGQWTVEDEGIRAYFNKVSLPFVHLLILPIRYLLVMPPEKSVINNDIGLDFEEMNKLTEQYMPVISEQGLDPIDITTSPHLNLPYEIESFRRMIIGL